MGSALWDLTMYCYKIYVDKYRINRFSQSTLQIEFTQHTSDNFVCVGRCFAHYKRNIVASLEVR